MEEFVKGDIIVLPFPFSDFSYQKKRPALVVAVPEGNDIIVCQITSHAHSDNYSIELEDRNFTKGSLNLKSYIRPNKIINIDKSIILYKPGTIQHTKLEEVINSIISILQN